MGKLRTGAENGLATSVRTDAKYTNKRTNLTLIGKPDDPYVWEGFVIDALHHLKEFSDIEIVESTLYKHKVFDHITFEWYIGFNPLENQLALW